MFNKILATLVTTCLIAITTAQAAAEPVARTIHPAIQNCLRHEKRSLCTRIMDCRFSQLRLAQIKEEYCYFALNNAPALIRFYDFQIICKGIKLPTDFDRYADLPGNLKKQILTSYESCDRLKFQAKYFAMIQTIIRSGIITQEELRLLIEQILLNNMATLGHSHSYYADDYVKIIYESFGIDNFDPEENHNYYDHCGHWSSKTSLSPTAIDRDCKTMVQTVVRELLPLIKDTTAEALTPDHREVPGDNGARRRLHSDALSL